MKGRYVGQWSEGQAGENVASSWGPSEGASSSSYQPVGGWGFASVLFASRGGHCQIRSD